MSSIVIFQTYLKLYIYIIITIYVVTTSQCIKILPTIINIYIIIRSIQPMPNISRKINCCDCLGFCSIEYGMIIVPTYS